MRLHIISIWHILSLMSTSSSRILMVVRSWDWMSLFIKNTKSVLSDEAKYVYPGYTLDTTVQ